MQASLLLGTRKTHFAKRGPPNKPMSPPAGVHRTIDVPYSSPMDWRDTVFYQLLVDRLNNPTLPPAAMGRHSCGLRAGP